MRSHDYCHFEICLGSEYESGEILPHQVDAMRKTAARLADKAVEQYKLAKLDAERQLADKQERAYLLQIITKIRATPEGQRTVGEQAKLKAYDDEIYVERSNYDYEDEQDQ